MKTPTTKPSKYLAVLAGVAVAVSAHATTIPLTNPSFEAPVVGAWSSGFLPDGWSWDYGSYIQTPGAHQGSQGVCNLGSANQFYRLSQNTTYTVAHANETITGKVWIRVTNLEKGNCHFRVELVLNSAGVVTNTFAVTPGMVTGQTYDWAEISVQYVTSAGDVGKTVGVAIGADGGDNSDGYSPSYCYMDEVSLDTVTIGGPTVVATASPNPVALFSNVLVSATVTPGANPTISSVVFNATALGGGSSVALVSAGGGVYTNTVAASAPTGLDTPLNLPVTATDGSALVGQFTAQVTVNRPEVLTWAGGVGNWNDANWLPYNLTGPLQGPNRTAIVTNGQVLVNQPGGIGGGVAIILEETGTMQVHNAHYGGYGNILFSGGTLDIYDDSAYHAYGASVLSSLVATGAITSTISNSGGTWFNLSDPASTFAVSNGATLNVMATLAGAVASNDNLYNPSGLTKIGAGTLILSGTNTYAGTTTVAEGALTLASSGALRANTTLTVAGGTTVNLNYSGTLSLGALVLNGVSQAAGTYGATGSGADHINNSFFSGTGVLAVGIRPTLSYVRLGGSQLQLSWTVAATLQVQTNSLATGISSTGWVDLPDVSPTTVTIDPEVGGVFFRLKQ